MQANHNVLSASIFDPNVTRAYHETLSRVPKMGLDEIGTIFKQGSSASSLEMTQAVGKRVDELILNINMRKTIAHEVCFNRTKAYVLPNIAISSLLTLLSIVDSSTTPYVKSAACLSAACSLIATGAIWGLDALESNAIARDAKSGNI